MIKSPLTFPHFLLPILWFSLLITMILNTEVVRADTLYVATTGNDISGDGSELMPWKTISYAFSKINGSQENPHTIYVKEGIYAPSNTGETYPVNVSSKNYLSLVGEELNNTILNAEYTGALFQFQNVHHFVIKNFIITNGMPRAIRCLLTSNFIIQNNIIENIDRGHFTLEGAINIADGAEVLIQNNVIRNNRADGLILGPSFSAIPVLKNNIIYNNQGHAPSQGGGIFIMNSNPDIGNTLENANDIFDNTPYNLEGVVTDTIQATFNYWGSEDYEVIRQSININKINFVPFTDSTHHSIFYVDNLPEDSSPFPLKYRLLQNFPNPFNTKTIINYKLIVTNYVVLSIFNILGEKVAMLVSERQEAGDHRASWDASMFASGVYYYIIEVGEFRDVKKMVLLR